MVLLAFTRNKALNCQVILVMLHLVKLQLKLVRNRGFILAPCFATHNVYSKVGVYSKNNVYATHDVFATAVVSAEFHH